ncbi:MAG: type II toxin-antitoxin system RelB/DinJ family antitoxin [Calditrichia bacterium]
MDSTTRTNRNTVVRARTDSKLKENAEGILKQLGFTMSDAINIYLNMIVMHRGIPFEIKIPSELTLETFKKSEAGEDLEHVGSLDNLKNLIDKQ